MKSRRRSDTTALNASCSIQGENTLKETHSTAAHYLSTMASPGGLMSAHKVRTTRVFFIGILAVASLAQAGTVSIHPGANIPSVVADNPAGTTFVIYPGEYRLQA